MSAGDGDREKWVATVSLGETNSRLKDIVDLEVLARTEAFDGAVVHKAIRRTFERRQTPLDVTAAALTAAYREDAASKPSRITAS